MNKSDMLKAAQKAEEYGVDPDTVMVTYTLDEFAESHGDEVDTFDEDRLAIDKLKMAIDDLQVAIEEAEFDLRETIEAKSTATSWLAKHELGQDERALERKLNVMKDELSKLVSKLDTYEQDFQSTYGGR